MSLIPNVSSGPDNRGNQVGVNYGAIHNTFQGEPPESSPHPIASIPFYQDPDFVDRGDLLDRLGQLCSKPPRRGALVGLGGVGKSQLAIEFAYRFSKKDAHAWVFWMHAGTRARIEQDLRNIANLLKLPGRDDPKANVPQLVSQWLSNEHNGRWLLVIDSADDQDVFLSAIESAAGVSELSLASYLPQSANGCIVITSRNKLVADRLTGQRDRSIEVGQMTDAEALTLLKTRLVIDSGHDEKVAGELVRALDLVPLAISQAAAYIQARAPRTSLVQYLTEFQASEQTRAKLLAYDAGDLRRDGGASNAILTTWQISFDYIRSVRSSAADLLALMSFFDPQGIPEQLLKGKISKQSKGGGAAQLSQRVARLTRRMTARLVRHSMPQNKLAMAYDDKTSEDDQFEDDLSMLQSYSLISTNEARVFEMHNLVQLTTKRWLAASGRRELFQQQYVELMAAAFPTGEYENWTVCRTLFAHVQAAIQYQPQDNKLALVWTDLLCNGAWYARQQGRYDVAEEMATRAWTTRKQRLGEKDLRTISSMALFASIMSDRGRWDEAESLQLEVSKTYKSKLGPDHPNTLLNMNSLAIIYRKQGRWDEAESLQVEVLKTQRSKLGPDHPNTLLNMNNLAIIYGKQGRWDEAESLQVEVLKTRRSKLGPDHPDTLGSMNNLATTYQEQGRWNEAESLQVEVLKTQRSKLGPDHPDTLGSMNNLAYAWESLGKSKDAVALMESCVAARQRVLGRDHPDTLLSIATLEDWKQ